MRRTLIALFVLLASTGVLADTVLIENVRIFNGVDARLVTGHVLVRDGLIDTISADPIAAPDGATVIAGNSRILTPGFIDLHVHLTFQMPAENMREHGTAAGARAVAMAKF